MLVVSFVKDLGRISCEELLLMGRRLECCGCSLRRDRWRRSGGGDDGEEEGGYRYLAHL
jgi:hypothetical protein